MVHRKSHKMKCLNKFHYHTWFSQVSFPCKLKLTLGKILTLNKMSYSSWTPAAKKSLCENGTHHDSLGNKTLDHIILRHYFSWLLRKNSCLLLGHCCAPCTGSHAHFHCLTIPSYFSMLLHELALLIKYQFIIINSLQQHPFFCCSYSISQASLLGLQLLNHSVT